MSCSTTTAPRPGETSTGAVRAISVTPGRAGRSARRFRSAVPPARPRSARDRGLAHDLRIVPPLDRIVDPEHPAGGFVGELQAAVRVDDEHPFDHARQDRRQARAIGLESARRLVRSCVRESSMPRHAADFVLAVVGGRSGQIALGVAPRALVDGAQPARQRAPRRSTSGRWRPTARPPVPAPPATDRRELAIDIGERQREAHERQQRHPRVVHGDRDVHHVGVDRGAVALRGAEPLLPRLHDLGPRAVVLDGAQLVRREIGVADDPAVGRDERDALPRIRPRASASASSSGSVAAL